MYKVHYNNSNSYYHCYLYYHYLFQLNTAQMLDNVSKLNLYQYRFRNEGEHGMGLRMGKVERRREVGLLAQEVETVIPEAVHHTVRGYVLITN